MLGSISPEMLRDVIGIFETCGLEGIVAPEYHAHQSLNVLHLIPPALSKTIASFPSSVAAKITASFPALLSIAIIFLASVEPKPTASFPALSKTVTRFEFSWRLSQPPVSPPYRR